MRFIGLVAHQFALAGVNSHDSDTLTVFDQTPCSNDWLHRDETCGISTIVVPQQPF